MIGTCTFWHSLRGYGFVTAADGTQYFLHITNFERGKAPVLGAFISFVLGQPLRLGQPLQVLNAKFATTEEIKQFQAEINKAGVAALAAPSQNGGAAQ